jgi:hypothetical protein
MGIQVDWFDPEHTIIRYTYRGDWGLKEFETAIDTGYALMRSVSHTVDSIIDMRDSSRPNENIFFQANKTVDRMPSNQGVIAIVGADLLTRSLHDAYVRVQGQLLKSRLDFRFCATIDEAYAQILSARNS